MNNDPIEIIKLPAEAWREYKALRLEALHEAPAAFGSVYAEQVDYPDSFWQTRLADAARGQKSWLLFARQGQRLVGLIGAFVPEDDPSRAHIVSVYVTEAARGKGLGRRLMQAILDELAQAGFKKASLGVNVDQRPALHLYQSFGFQVVHTEPRHLMGNGEYHDQYIMEKALTA